MALVSTMPEKGQQAKVYDIPEDQLAKFDVVEGTKATYDEDVQAYSDICICYFWWRGVLYYRYQYCWQDCP
jgi:hypothetical protein